MRAYMAYSRFCGSQEGAVLVIAPSSRVARSMAYKYMACLNVEGWLDQVVRWIRDSDIMALSNGTDAPHIVDIPESCESCDLWGCGIDNHNGTCQWCGEFVGTALRDRYMKYWKENGFLVEGVKDD